MLLPNRHDSDNEGYRYGFNGMEKDNEVKGNGNSYTTEFRQYDPRLGRWLSLDPLMHQFPWMSPYVAFNNNPIYFTDPLGLASEGAGDPPKEGDERINPNSGATQVYMGGEWAQKIGSVDVEHDRSLGITHGTWNPPSKKGSNGWSVEVKTGDKVWFKDGLKSYEVDGWMDEFSRQAELYNRQQEAQNWSFWDLPPTGIPRNRSMDGVGKGLNLVMLGPVAEVVGIPTLIAEGTTLLASSAPYIWKFATFTGSTVWTGGKYAIEGTRWAGETLWKNKVPHKLGVNYAVQSGQTGSLNPLDHNMFGYGLSLGTSNSTSIETQCYIGATGGLINYTPNRVRIYGFWNRPVGITLVDVLNGGIAPLYNLASPGIGFFMGNTQQIIGGRVINHLEQTYPK